MVGLLPGLLPVLLVIAGLALVGAPLPTDAASLIQVRSQASIAAASEVHEHGARNGPDSEDADWDGSNAPDDEELGAPPRRLLGRFLVVTSQRAGSHWLDSEIDKHPCIHMLPELFIEEEFADDNMRRRAANLFFRDSMELETEDDRRFWQTAPPGFKWYSEFANESNRSYYARPGIRSLAKSSRNIRGFDWKIDRGFNESQSWFLPFAIKHGIRILWLRRRNLLRQTWSGTLLNMNLSEAAKTHHGDLEQNLTVTVKADHILHEMQNVKAREDAAAAAMRREKRAGLQVMPLWYEDMVSGNSTYFTEVRRFLLAGTACSTPPEAVDTAPIFLKMHKKPLSQVIKNWGALKALLLKKPEFAWMVDNE